MKRLILMMLIMSFNSFAIDEKCKTRIHDSLKTESQVYLFEKYPNLIDTFVKNCNKDSFGDMGLLSGIVFIHEAAHFEDFGWQSETIEHDHSNHQKVDIFLPDNSHIGHLEKTSKLPVIKNVLRPFWKKNNKKLLKKETLFNDINEGYIGANDSIAAVNIEGMATELNAYTHGLIFEQAIKKDFPQSVELETENGQKFQYPNPMKELDQIQGVYYFLYAFDDYLSQVSTSSPADFETFMSQANIEFLRKLFNSSVQALNSIDHCSVGKKEEKTKYWLSLIQNKIFSSAFRGIIGESNLSSLQCTNLEATIFEFENLNSDKEEQDHMIFDSEQTEKNIIINENLKTNNSSSNTSVIQN